MAGEVGRITTKAKLVTKCCSTSGARRASRSRHLTFLLRSRPSFRNWQTSKSPNEGQSLVNLQRADQQSCLSASAFSDEAWVFEMESRRLWPTLGYMAVARAAAFGNPVLHRILRVSLLRSHRHQCEVEVDFSQVWVQRSLEYAKVV